MASAPSAALRQRKRKLCSKCGQNLSHTAYIRHQNPLVCPGNLKRKLTEPGLLPELTDRPPTTSAKLLHCDAPQTEDITPSVDYGGTESDYGADSPTESNESASDCEDHEPSAPDQGVEIVSDTEEDDDSVDKGEGDVMQCDQAPQSSTPSHMESKAEEEVSIIATHICLFISFFQLCYRIPERGITLLLNFLRALLLWLSKYLRKSTQVLALHDLKKNVYFLQKALSCTIKLHNM